jgi:uncharacterized protein (TIGR02594 family)
MKPVWLHRAEQYLGLKEVHGPAHAPEILKWWKLLGSGVKDDETAWCAAFVGGVLEECGLVSTRAANARSYTRWGARLYGPAVGAVVTFWRGKPDGWQGHVGFVVGKDAKGNLMVLGGNQADSVSIAPFDTDRVLQFNWPGNQPLPEMVGYDTLPIVASNGKLSTNEA